ncbi:pro-sigmaK processing inhibitor BofA family protein [Thalassorhabdus alkalitolerans]|uniref:Pro-sigmaK processing inhibitor BofA family protein n=1 Tax=Thalassorhabdus alkalitolerans TaxID=2282697 RepID=A0ABW0YMR5_9BACI
MDPILLISALGLLVFFILFVTGPFKPFRWIGKGVIRLMIGALALFFLNVFGSAVGYHIPLNLFTVSISGLLGIPGVALLVVVDLLILP